MRNIRHLVVFPTMGGMWVYDPELWVEVAQYDAFIATVNWAVKIPALNSFLYFRIIRDPVNRKLNERREWTFVVLAGPDGLHEIEAPSVDLMWGFGHPSAPQALLCDGDFVWLLDLAAGPAHPVWRRVIDVETAAAAAGPQPGTPRSVWLTGWNSRTQTAYVELVSVLANADDMDSWSAFVATDMSGSCVPFDPTPPGCADILDHVYRSDCDTHIVKAKRDGKLVFAVVRSGELVWIEPAEDRDWAECSPDGKKLIVNCPCEDDWWLLVDIEAGRRTPINVPAYDHHPQWAV